MKVAVILPAAGLGTRMGKSIRREGRHQPQAVHAAGRLADPDPHRPQVRGFATASPRSWWRCAREDLRVGRADAARSEFRGNACAWWKAATAGRNRWRTRWRRSSPDTDLVAVHDAVRPFIDLETIHKVFDEAAETGAAIVGVVPAVDTVKQVTRGTEHVRVRVDHPAREAGDGADAAGVPLRAAHRAPSKRRASDGFTGTDESSLVERLDVEVSVVPGSDRNIKITKPGDMELARLFLRDRRPGREP